MTAKKTIEIEAKFRDLATKQLDKMGSTLTKLGRVGVKAFKSLASGVSRSIVVMNQFGQLAGQVSRAIGRLGSAMLAVVDVASQQEQAEMKVNAVLQATGEAAGFTSEALRKMASEYQNLTGIGDEMILNGQAVLLTFKNIKAEGGIFEGVLERAMDLKVLLGGDLQAAVVMLGKAFDDPILGLSALRRVGVSFSAQQTESIKGMVEMGDLLGAQGMMLETLEGQLGGLALAYGETFAGALDKTKSAYGDLLEKVGDFIIKSPLVLALLERLTTTFKTWGEEIANSETATRSFDSILKTLITKTLPALIDGMVAFSQAMVATITNIDKFTTAVSALWSLANLQPVTAGVKVLGLLKGELKETSIAATDALDKLSVMAQEMRELDLSASVAADGSDELGDSFDALGKQGDVASSAIAKVGKQSGNAVSLIGGLVSAVGRLKGMLADLERADPKTFSKARRRAVESLKSEIFDYRRALAGIPSLHESWGRIAQRTYGEIRETPIKEQLVELTQLRDAIAKAYETTGLETYRNGVTQIAEAYDAQTAAARLAAASGGTSIAAPIIVASEDPDFLAAMERIRLTAVKAGEGVGEGVKGSVEDAADEADSLFGDMSRSMGRSLESGLASFFVEFARGTGSSVENFKNAMLAALMQIAAQAAAIQFLGFFGLGAHNGGLIPEFHEGGEIQHFANGGTIQGRGGRDKVPAMVETGEFVINRRAVNRIGVPMLAAINSGRDDEQHAEQLSKFGDKTTERIQHFTNGGTVQGRGGRDKVPAVVEAGEFVMNRRAVQAVGVPALASMNSGNGGGGTANINFTINASDAAGFDELLAKRKRDIVGMISDAMSRSPQFRGQIRNTASGAL